MAFEFKNIKHGSNIVELGPGYSLHEEITAPMIAAFGEKDLEDSDLPPVVIPLLKSQLV